jgi:hypothetical protein
MAGQSSFRRGCRSYRTTIRKPWLPGCFSRSTVSILMALRWFAQCRLAMMGGKVLFDGKVLHKPLILQPEADAVIE